MTVNDFLKRIDIEKDKDKMIIISDGVGWTNLDHLSIKENSIELYPQTDNGPFSSDR